MNAVSIPTRLPLPSVAGVTPQQWRVLTDAIFPGAKTAEAICLALDYCRARRLDVFKRPVHIVPMYNSALRREVETVWPSINELQTTAGRTNKWAGMDAPEWGPLVNQKFEGWVGKDEDRRKITAEVTFPEWCSVTVYRMVSNQRCAFTETVYWLESYGRIGRSEVPNDMWQKRPRGQLHKCTKAAVLRAAFPEDVGNDYAAEEMEGKETEAGGITIEHEPDVAGRELRDTQSTPERGRYPFYGPDAKVIYYGTAAEWIETWRRTIAACRPLQLRRGADVNREHIDAVAEHNAESAEEVRRLIAVALGEVEMELPA